MNKKVLVMCTGNSCRSIIAEALINAKLEGVSAYSAGTKPKKNIHKNAIKILQEKGIWLDTYYSKHLDNLIELEFDLVVTVCDHAHETCPMFPQNTKKMHISFEDPDGLDYKAFEKTYNDIDDILILKVKKALA